MLYAVNAPFSKILLNYIPSTLLAGFLYLGAGAGMLLLALIKRLSGKNKTEQPLTKNELPYIAGMILLDIAAPICLLWGLKTTTAASASLLNNFEIAATAIIALCVFKEKISARLWCGIIFVTLSCGVLSFESAEQLRFSGGALLVLLAAVLWGFENNCTRKISSKNPMQIVLLKGVFSGAGSVVIGLAVGERVKYVRYIFIAMAVGLVAYGLSIFCYVYAQRFLGAARTSAYYAAAPFISAALSLVIFKQMPQKTYLAALALMLIGAVLCANDNAALFKKIKNLIIGRGI